MAQSLVPTPRHGPQDSTEELVLLHLFLPSYSSEKTDDFQCKANNYRGWQNCHTMQKVFFHSTNSILPYCHKALSSSLTATIRQTVCRQRFLPSSFDAQLCLVQKAVTRKALLSEAFYCTSWYYFRELWNFCVYFCAIILAWHESKCLYRRKEKGS